MVFVIAECGVNWRDLVDADQMIKAAAEAGADAVKFQAYQPKFFGSYGIPDLSYEGYLFHPRAEELNQIALDKSTVRYLYWRCQQHGIEFVCTPMYPGAVAMLDPYVKRWKVRYADRENETILASCRATGKPMLISGTNLLCSPEYPPSNEPLCGKGFTGFSCHFPNVDKAARAATIPEFQYLEVHVRLDHYEPPHYCPIDTAVSITMSELAELCRRLK